MKKDTAQALHDDLVELFNNYDSQWLPKLEHTESGRDINYFIRLRQTGSNPDIVPIIPDAVREVTQKHNIPENDHYRYIRKIIPDSDTDPHNSHKHPPKNHLGEHYEMILDTRNFETIPRDPDDVRESQLRSDINDIFSLPTHSSAAKNLAAEFDSIAEIVSASEQTLRNIKGVGEKRAQKLLDPRTDDLQEQLNNTSPDDVLIVQQTENGLFEPCYIPDSDETIIERLRKNI